LRGFLLNNPKDFVQRSNLRGFLALGRDWGAIIGTIAFSLWADNIFVYLISIWVIGTFQYALGEVLLHEGSHYNLFKNKKLNNILAPLYSLPFFVTITQYRDYHTDHHYKMNTEADHIVEDYEIHGLNNTNKNMFWLWFIKPIVGYGAYFYIRHAIELNPLKSALQMLIFWIPIFGVFIYFGRLDILIFYWFVPFLWSFTSHLYWSEINEHYNTKSGTRSDLGFKNHILHNAGYHYVHHHYPSIPWYLLPKAHKALCADSEDISRGFIDTYRKLKQPHVYS
jgi:fatty acid desaturase